MHRRFVAAAAVAGLVLTGTASAAAAPPNRDVVNGNNGTVKATVADGSCQVTVDWYGMDAAAESVVEFRLHGGSGSDLLLDEVVHLDDDAVHGGQLDGSRTFDLGPAIAEYGGTPEDRYHVKLTTHTTWSNGADTKHKVFWVTGCEDSGGGGNQS